MELRVFPGHTQLGSGSYGNVSQVKVIRSRPGVSYQSLDAAEKMPLDDQWSSETLRELVAYSLLSESPFIIQPLAAGITDKNGHVLYMPLAMRDMHHLSINRGHVAWKQLLRYWTYAITRGVQHLHQHKIIHQDLKLPNILLSPKGIPWITDLGAAALPDSGDTYNVVSFIRCTVFARPPEWEYPLAKYVPQSDPSGDIWSLGMMFYTLCTDDRLIQDIESSTEGCWQVAGKPTAAQWPVMSNLPESNRIYINCESREDRMDKLRELSSSIIPEELLDLICSMLHAIPSQRFTMEQILAHPWFADLTDDEVLTKTHALVTEVVNLKGKKVTHNFKAEHVSCLKQHEHYWLDERWKVQNSLSDPVDMISHDGKLVKYENCRHILFTWLLEVYSKQMYQHHVIILDALQMIDLFARTESFARKELQLIGITCLSLAFDLHSSTSIQCRHAVYYTAGAYTVSEMEEMRKRIVIGLKGKLLLPPCRRLWTLMRREYPAGVPVSTSLFRAIFLLYSWKGCLEIEPYRLVRIARDGIAHLFKRVSNGQITVEEDTILSDKQRLGGLSDQNDRMDFDLVEGEIESVIPRLRDWLKTLNHEKDCFTFKDHNNTLKINYRDLLVKS